MKKQILFLFLGIFLISFTSAYNFSGGTGTSGSPYQITNWSALNDMRYVYDVGCAMIYFKLMNDLNSSMPDYISNFRTIGTGGGCGLVGGFDGNGKTIEGLRITTSQNYQGLFWQVQLGYIKNLTLNNSYVTNSNSVTGTLVAIMSGGTITNIKVINGTVNGQADTGGLFGRYSQGTSTDNEFNGVVTGYEYVGGISGKIAYVSTLTRNRFNGNVTASYRAVGGIGGSVSHTTSTAINLINCSSSGIIKTNDATYSYAGGLAGLLTGTIKNSYSNATIIGKGSYVGGLVGQGSNYFQLINVSSDSTITCSNTYCGGIMGYAANAPNSATAVILNNLSFYGNLNSNNTYVGGIIGASNVGGFAYNPTLNNSYFGGVINASGTNYKYVGGIIGYVYTSNNSLTMIENSVSNGTIYSRQNYTGGLVGYQWNGIIRNSYSLSSIYGSNYCGGGVSFADYNSTILNIYSSGLINCTGLSAGLVYQNSTNTTINNSFWDINATGQTTSDGGGVGKTTDELKNKSTFTGWTISQTQIDINNGYPYLAWQNGSKGVWKIWTLSCWFFEGDLLIIPPECELLDFSGISGDRWVTL